MNTQEATYRQLWDDWSNITLAKKILHDNAISPSLRAIAHYVLHDYQGLRELCEKHNEDPTDVFWPEVRLIMGYLQHLEQHTPLDEIIDDLKSDAEALTSLASNLIFPRLLLAGMLASQRDYQRSISTYASVLSISPTNLRALVGLMGAAILARQSEYARHVLRRAQKVVSEMSDIKRRIYWQLTFFIYGFRVYIERSILVGLAVFVMAFLVAFFRPLSWTMLIIGLGAFLPFVLLALQKKDPWAVSILARLFIIISICWLMGYGVNALFVFMEHL